jgi:hypothetical protein
MQTSFWNGNSHYQFMADRLNTLIPLMGSVEDPKRNPALEKFRIASGCYYDLFNNGLGNRARQFGRVFGVRLGDFVERRRAGFHTEYDISALGRVIEPVMERIVLDAVKEQFFSREAA